MNLKVLKNTSFLLKQQIYIMLLASSFAFANQKAGVCKSSFNSLENNASKESNSADRVASFMEKNINETKKETFPPLYSVRRNADNYRVWEPVQQDPINKNKIQESFWELVFESLGKNYKNGSYGIREDLQFLISNGADISAKDERGWTALDYAVKNENYHLVSALTDASLNSVRGGYRSFMKSVFGAWSNTEGYSASDYKRALRIAKKNMQTAIENREKEHFTHTFHNERTVELSRFKPHEKEKVNEEIIKILKQRLYEQRLSRAGQTVAVSFSSAVISIVYHVFF